MRTSARVHRFDPAIHGLRFPNNFGDATWFEIIHARGLCGGMSFAVLDAFYAGRAAPTMTATPPVSSPFGAYIKRRQLDSIAANGARFLAWIVEPFDWLIAASTEAIEWARLRAAIDAQTPVPIGLVAGPYNGGANATDSHQVVAIGYREEHAGERVVLCWDPNHRDADREIRRAPGSIAWRGPGRGDRWRGWFVETYTPAPPAGADA